MGGGLATPGIHLMMGIDQMGASLAEQKAEPLNLAALALLYGMIATMGYCIHPLGQAEGAPS